MALGVVCDDKIVKAKAQLGETEDGVAAGGLHKVQTSAEESLCTITPTCCRSDIPSRHVGTWLV